MTQAVNTNKLFHGRHFRREVIILCMRWYLRFKLSFRDLVDMMAERGLYTLLVKPPTPQGGLPPVRVVACVAVPASERCESSTGTDLVHQGQSALGRLVTGQFQRQPLFAIWSIVATALATPPQRPRRSSCCGSPPWSKTADARQC